MSVLAFQHAQKSGGANAALPRIGTNKGEGKPVEKSCETNPQVVPSVDGSRRRGERGAMLRGPDRSRIRHSDSRFLRDHLTVESVTKVVSSVLAQFEAKDIVQATGGSIRAAQNVREGLNAMSLTSFLNACRNIPELRAAALQMMGAEAETDPEFVRGLSLLVSNFVRRQHNEDQ